MMKTLPNTSSADCLWVDSVGREASTSTPHLTEQALTQSLNSAELFKGAHQIMIEHGNDVYCLRLTKQGKLILTK